MRWLTAFADDVKDLSIAAQGGVVTTIEVHNAIRLRLHLSSSSSLHSKVNGAAAVGSSQPSEYGLLSLDPSLDDVRISYGSPELVGAIVLAAPMQQVDRDLRHVSVSIVEGSSIELAEEDGLSASLRDGTAAEGGTQFRIQYAGDKWVVQNLERKEKDYPVFGST